MMTAPTMYNGALHKWTIWYTPGLIGSGLLFWRRASGGLLQTEVWGYAEGNKRLRVHAVSQKGHKASLSISPVSSWARMEGRVHMSTANSWGRKIRSELKVNNFGCFSVKEPSVLRWKTPPQPLTPPGGSLHILTVFYTKTCINCVQTVSCSSFTHERSNLSWIKSFIFHRF